MNLKISNSQIEQIKEANFYLIGSTFLIAGKDNRAHLIAYSLEMPLIIV